MNESAPEDLMNTYASAHQLAHQYFDGIFYGKDSSIPMMVHLEGVVDILREYLYGIDERYLIVGILHDLLEDTSCPESRLIEFGTCVRIALDLCTDGKEGSRKERKAHWAGKWALAKTSERHFETMSSAMRIARVVKVADRLYNVRSCVRDGNEGLLSMYRKEHDFFQQVLNPEPKSSLWLDLCDTIGD